MPAAEPARHLSAVRLSPGSMPAAMSRGLDALFGQDEQPQLGALLPAAAAALCAATTQQVWCLAWLVLCLGARAARLRLARAYAARPARDKPAAWDLRYRNGLLWEALVLGLGLGLAVLSLAPAFLAPLCMAAGTWLETTRQKRRNLPAEREIVTAALAPTVLACAAFPSLPNLALAAFCGLMATSLLTETATAPAAAAAAEPESPGAAPPVPRAVQEFQRLLGRDQITGLPNRPGFLRILADESQRAMRAEAPLSLLLLSVDHLPDLFAEHAEHNQQTILAALARGLRGTLRRQSDQVACLSAGCFAVVLPFTDAVGATAAARNIMAAFAPPPAEEHTVRAFPAATFSIGLSAYSGRGGCLDSTLLAQAEEAEGAARNQGGNRLVRYDPMAVTLKPPTYAEKQAALRVVAENGAVVPAGF